MRASLAAAAILLASRTPVGAHRLDEYLQATLLSVSKHAVTAEMTLTPGVAVYPVVLAEIDKDADGVISDSEQRAYGERVLHDLLLAVDGHRLTPRLVSLAFPSVEQMKDGLGEIRIAFAADLIRGGPNRTLTLENRHIAGISAYQVNCLAPDDRDIRVLGQRRNYTQSFYELDYAQAGVRSASLFGADRGGWMAVLALGLALRLLWVWRRKHG
jgi:hypothetical protein